MNEVQWYVIVIVIIFSNIGAVLQVPDAILRHDFSVVSNLLFLNKAI